MVYNDEYEIVSIDRLNELKDELNKLKESISQPTELKKSDLIVSMDELNKNISSLTGLFKEASDELREEEKVGAPTSDIMAKLESISEQNEKIASGILALVDLIRDENKEIKDMLKGRSMMPQFKKQIPVLRQQPQMGIPPPPPPPPQM